MSDKHDESNECVISGGYTCSVEAIDCVQILNIPIYKEGRNIGRIVLLNTVDKILDDRELLLMDMIIYQKQDRHKGAAGAALEYIKTWCPVIVTGVLSEAGKKTCLNHGFKEREKQNDDEPDFLFYINEDWVDTKEQKETKQLIIQPGRQPIRTPPQRIVRAR